MVGFKKFALLLLCLVEFLFCLWSSFSLILKILESLIVSIIIFNVYLLILCILLIFTDYPEYWSKHDGELKLVLLDEDGEEFAVVSSQFLSTLLQIEILRIERIQNKILWRKYIDCAKRISERNNGKTSEMMLFHGTRHNKPELIYKGDASFDMRFSNTGYWGRGNYFAVNSSYSHSYAHCCTTGQHQMLVANVITGYASTCKQDKTLTHPPVRITTSNEVDIHYDSVSGMTQDSKVFITYNNDQAYPAYLITYTLIK